MREKKFLLSNWQSSFCWKSILLFSLLMLCFSSCGTKQPEVVKPIACGTVTSTEVLSANAEHAQVVGTCFFKAYQKCQAATFTYIDQDQELEQDQEKTTRIFNITSGTSPCHVSLNVQVNSTSVTATCAKIEGFRGGAGGLNFIKCGSSGTFYLTINDAIQ